MIGKIINYFDEERHKQGIFKLLSYLLKNEELRLLEKNIKALVSKQNYKTRSVSGYKK